MTDVPAAAKAGAGPDVSAGAGGNAPESAGNAPEPFIQARDGETPDQIDARWLRDVYRGEGDSQLTLRAVLTGALLGALMALSNLYVGLKAGWALGVAITACILSHSLWQGLVGLRLARSPLSLLESNCMQSTASAAGFSTVSIMVSAVPAYLMLTGVMVRPLWLVLWTFFLSMLGVMMAIPLKRQMINREQLAFPSGVAAAQTLRGLHERGSEAVRQARALFAAMGVGALSGWLSGNTFRWWRLPRLPESLSFPGRLAGFPLSDYTIGVDLGAVSIAAGALIGLRTTVWMLAGSALNYLIIVPWLLRSGRLEAVDYRLIHRSFSLWAGAAIMISASLTSLALQWRVVGRGLRELATLVSGVTRRRRVQEQAGALAGAAAEAAPLRPAARLAALELPGGWFAFGLVAASTGIVLVGYRAFAIAPGLSLLSIALSFVLVMVASRATGETDITPSGDMGKITQLVFGVVAPGSMTGNIMMASVTSAAAASSSDLLVDLKCGYLLGASPRPQFLAQFLGVVAGTAVVVPAFTLIVPRASMLGTPALPAPAAQAWQTMAELMIAGASVLNDTARWGLLFGLLVGILIPLLEEAYPKRARWIPSPFGLGLGLVIYFSNSAAFFVGALLAWLFARRSPQRAQRYSVPIASGLIAGESLIGVLLAALIALGVMPAE